MKLFLVLALVLAPIQALLVPKWTTYNPTNSALNVLWDPRNVDDDSGFVDFPTPEQKSALRKEASKRQARKKLATLHIPGEETYGPFSEGTMETIWGLLREHELLQVRGISKEERRHVFGLAERLCLELEMTQTTAKEDDVILPVALLSTKGHAAVIYSPTLDLNDPKKFPLRTSVGQKNTWTARVKAPRDHRGQIIREPKQEE